MQQISPATAPSVYYGFTSKVVDSWPSNQMDWGQVPQDNTALYGGGGAAVTYGTTQLVGWSGGTTGQGPGGSSNSLATGSYGNGSEYEGLFTRSTLAGAVKELWKTPSASASPVANPSVDSSTASGGTPQFAGFTTLDTSALQLSSSPSTADLSSSTPLSPSSSATNTSSASKFSFTPMSSGLFTVDGSSSGVVSNGSNGSSASTGIGSNGSSSTSVLRSDIGDLLGGALKQNTTASGATLTRVAANNGSTAGFFSSSGLLGMSSLLASSNRSGVLVAQNVGDAFNQLRTNTGNTVRRVLSPIKPFVPQAAKDTFNGLFPKTVPQSSDSVPTPLPLMPNSPIKRQILDNHENALSVLQRLPGNRLAATKGYGYVKAADAQVAQMLGVPIGTRYLVFKDTYKQLSSSADNNYIKLLIDNEPAGIAYSKATQAPTTSEPQYRTTLNDLYSIPDGAPLTDPLTGRRVILKSVTDPLLAKGLGVAPGTRIVLGPNGFGYVPKGMSNDALIRYMRTLPPDKVYTAIAKPTASSTSNGSSAIGITPNNYFIPGISTPQSMFSSNPFAQPTVAKDQFGNNISYLRNDGSISTTSSMFDPPVRTEFIGNVFDSTTGAKLGYIPSQAPEATLESPKDFVNRQFDSFTQSSKDLARWGQTADGKPTGISFVPNVAGEMNQLIAGMGKGAFNAVVTDIPNLIGTTGGAFNTIKNKGLFIWGTVDALAGLGHGATLTGYDLVTSFATAPVKLLRPGNDARDTEAFVAKNRAFLEDVITYGNGSQGVNPKSSEYTAGKEFAGSATNVGLTLGPVVKALVPTKPQPAAVIDLPPTNPTIAHAPALPANPFKRFDAPDTISPPSTKPTTVTVLPKPSVAFVAHAPTKPAVSQTLQKTVVPQAQSKTVDSAAPQISPQSQITTSPMRNATLSQSSNGQLVVTNNSGAIQLFSDVSRFYDAASNRTYVLDPKGRLSELDPGKLLAFYDLNSNESYVSVSGRLPGYGASTAPNSQTTISFARGNNTASRNLVSSTEPNFPKPSKVGLIPNPLDPVHITATAERYINAVSGETIVRGNYPVHDSPLVVSSDRTPGDVGNAIKFERQIELNKSADPVTKSANAFVNTPVGRDLMNRLFGAAETLDFQVQETGIRTQGTGPWGQNRFFTTFDDLLTTDLRKSLDGSVADVAKRGGRGALGNYLDTSASDQIATELINRGLKQVTNVDVGAARTNFYEFSLRRNRADDGGTGAIVPDQSSPSGWKLNVSYDSATREYVLLRDLETKVMTQTEASLGLSIGSLNARTVQYPGGRSGYGLIPAGTRLSVRDMANMEWSLRNPAMFYRTGKPNTISNAEPLFRFWEVNGFTQVRPKLDFQRHIEFSNALDGARLLRVDFGFGTGLPSLLHSFEGGLVLKLYARPRHDTANPGK
jgi:hypothetical protein